MRDEHPLDREREQAGGTPGTVGGGASRWLHQAGAASMNAAELALRRRIFESFAATGAPPSVPDGPALRGLQAAHVVVLGPDREILMAHPFAAHRAGARVDCGDRTWWGNCAWDGLGIVAALGLPDARVSSHGIALDVARGALNGDAVFHVSVPARRWWEDIAFT